MTVVLIACVLVVASLTTLIRPAIGTALLLGSVLVSQPLSGASGDAMELNQAGALDEAILLGWLLGVVGSVIRGEGRRSIVCLLTRLQGWWWTVAGLLLFLASGVISGVLRGVPARVLTEGSLLAVKGPLVLFGVVLLSLDRDAARSTIRILLATLSIVLVTAVVHFAWPALFANVPGIVENVRAGRVSAAGMMLVPGTLAVVMAMATALAMGLWSKSGRPVLLVLGLAFAMGLLLSLRARAPLIVLVLVTVSLLMRFRLANWRAIAGVVVLMLGLGLGVVATPVGSPVRGLVEERIATYVFLGSDGARVALYSGSATLARDYFPLGAGFGRFGSATSARHYSPEFERLGLEDVFGIADTRPRAVTDSQWVMALGESGVVGLLAFIGFVVGLAWQLWKNRRAALFGVGLLVAIVMLMESPFGQSITGAFGVLFMAVIALSAVGDGPVSRDDRKEVVHFGPDRHGVGGIASVLAAYERGSWPEKQPSFVATYRRGAKLHSVWPFACGLWQVVKRAASGTTIYHFHLSHRGSFVREGLLVRLASWLRVPVCVTIHGSLRLDDRLSTEDRVRRVLESADAIVVAGAGIRIETERVTSRTKVFVVPNPAPAVEGTRRRIRETKHVVIFAGDVSRAKGVEVLLDAWSTVRERVPQAELRIAGYLIDVEAVDLEGVVWLGPMSREEVMDRMKEARVCVLPSTTHGESLPLTILEAMTLELPVVTTPKGAIPEYLTGFVMMTEPGDSQSLANAISKALSDDDFAEQLGRYGSAQVMSRLNIAHIVDELSDVYDYVVSGRSSLSMNVLKGEETYVGRDGVSAPQRRETV